MISVCPLRPPGWTSNALTHLTCRDLHDFALEIALWPTDEEEGEEDELPKEIEMAVMEHVSDPQAQVEMIKRLKFERSYESKRDPAIPSNVHTIRIASAQWPKLLRTTAVQTLDSSESRRI